MATRQSRDRQLPSSPERDTPSVVFDQATGFFELSVGCRKQATSESTVLSALREKSSMQRHSRSLLFGWFVVMILGLTASHLPLMAQEPTKSAEPGHGADVKASSGGHASAAENPDPMEVKPTLAIWTLVVFVLVLLVLGQFAWKPLLEALHKREAHLEHVLLETERGSK